MPWVLEGRAATLAPMPKFLSSPFTLRMEEAMSHIRNSSLGLRPGPVFHRHSLRTPSTRATETSTRWPPDSAIIAASIAFLTISRDIMVFGQRSMRLETRKSSSPTWSFAATASDIRHPSAVVRCNRLT